MVTNMLSRFVKHKYVRAVGLWETTDGSKLRQKPILQINNCLTNLVIFTNQIIIHNSDTQILRNRDVSSQFEHPKQTKQSVMEVLKDVRANCFCASLLRTAARANSHATSCIERARQVLKWTMIGKMAIDIALLGFNDLGRSVTPTFLFGNRFYLQLSLHCSKMNKKSMWEVKKIPWFLSARHGILSSCGCKARETMVSKCELILWVTSPVD